MTIISIDIPMPPSANAMYGKGRGRVIWPKVIEAYERLGSVWKAGKELGIPGQRVHSILKRVGHPTNARPITEAERRIISDYYSNTAADDFDSTALAKQLGRTRHLVSRVAGEMGLTRPSRAMSRAAREAMKITRSGQWQRKPHPRGFEGKTHTPEARAKVSQASKKAWATMKAFGVGNMSEEARAASSLRMAIIASKRDPSKNYTRTKGGRRPDLDNRFFRSSWEANYARYLNLLMRLGAVDRWEFEPETFWFEDVRRGTRSYLPDFRVWYRGDPTPEYVEIKGWVTPKDRTKWRRMKKYHPSVKLVVVGEKQYYAIQKKWASAIPNWETQSRVRVA